MTRACKYNYTDLVSIALNLDANVNVSEDYCIQIACSNNNPEITELLLRAGANVFAISEQMLTKARAYGHDELIAVLTKYGLPVSDDVIDFESI